jgi:capsular polysaccharide biosynthesis protein
MKGRIDYSQLIKEPTASVRPVSPKKDLNILLAGLLALVIFMLIAFFLEYRDHNVPKKSEDD